MKTQYIFAIVAAPGTASRVVQAIPPTRGSERPSKTGSAATRIGDWSRLGDHRMWGSVTQAPLPSTG
jgi:hypothetical protein